MNALLDDMQSAIEILAGPRQSGDTRESMIARAARKAGISYRQAKSFFYREAVNPSGLAVISVQRALAALTAAQDVRGECERIAKLEAENAFLRQVIASALAGTPRTTVAQAERGDFSCSAEPGSQPYGESLSDRALAQAYGVQR
jgi:hypothetical protein